MIFFPDLSVNNSSYTIFFYYSLVFKCYTKELLGNSEFSDSDKSETKILPDFFSFFIFYFFMNQNKPLIPENRPFKTLSSIRKEINAFKIFQSYIQFDKLLFSEDLFQNQEILLNEVLSYLQQQEDKNLFQYLIKLISLFFTIRPKQRQIPYFLISKILSIIEQDNSNSAFNTIKEKPYFTRSFVIDNLDLFFKNIIKTDPLIAEVKQKYFSFYDPETLEFILKEDDINALKTYMNSKQKFGILD